MQPRLVVRSLLLLITYIAGEAQAQTKGLCGGATTGPAVVLPLWHFPNV